MKDHHTYPYSDPLSFFLQHSLEVYGREASDTDHHQDGTHPQDRFQTIHRGRVVFDWKK